MGNFRFLYSLHHPEHRAPGPWIFLHFFFRRLSGLPQTLHRPVMMAHAHRKIRRTDAVPFHFTESILDNPDLDPERQRFFIERSYQQARRLTALLQDISTLNKLNEGKDLYDKTECNLADIIKNVHHDVQLFAEQKDCKINLEITQSAIIVLIFNVLKTQMLAR